MSVADLPPACGVGGSEAFGEGLDFFQGCLEVFGDFGGEDARTP